MTRPSTSVTDAPTREIFFAPVKSVKNNNEVLSLRLPSNVKQSSYAGIEGPFIINDIDNDGKPELLLECDEKLMCYDFSSLEL